MNINILATAAALSDHDLLARLDALADNERGASAELVAHLAALDARPALYAEQGFGSLFSYCTQALRLSEDAACNRIEAARSCRRFPVILELLDSGALSLTSVRLLRPHLTPENHQVVLAKASGRARREIEVLIAALAPRPDLTSSVRKLPVRTATDPVAGGPGLSSATLATLPPSQPAAISAPPALRPPARPVVQATAPERYRVQFTVGKETHEKLRRLQALLRREIPDGDPGAIFDRALTLLLEKVEKTKMGVAAKPLAQPVIRPGTDSGGTVSASRVMPRSVRRTVWKRDGGQCAFVASTGRRCTERAYLELHHIQPYAEQGPATVENISLRCRRHNQYEADVFFEPFRNADWKTRPTPPAAPGSRCCGSAPGCRGPAGRAAAGRRAAAYGARRPCAVWPEQLDSGSAPARRCAAR